MFRFVSCSMVVIVALLDARAALAQSTGPTSNVTRRPITGVKFTPIKLRNASGQLLDDPLKYRVYDILALPNGTDVFLGFGDLYFMSKRDILVPLASKPADFSSTEMEFDGKYLWVYGDQQKGEKSGHAV
ncbi:MAG TPA: hypothetical protein VH518_21915 [Tepidisphaeraceae bacterium]